MESVTSSSVVSWQRVLGLQRDRCQMYSLWEAHFASLLTDPSPSSSFMFVMTETILPAFQRINDKLALVRDDPASASLQSPPIGKLLATWAAEIQVKEKKKFEATVAYQRAVIAHLTKAQCHDPDCPLLTLLDKEKSRSKGGNAAVNLLTRQGLFSLEEDEEAGGGSSSGSAVGGGRSCLEEHERQQNNCCAFAGEFSALKKEMRESAGLIAEMMDAAQAELSDGSSL